MLDIGTLSTTVGEYQRDYIFKLQVDSYPSAIDTILGKMDAKVAALDLLINSAPIPPSATKDIEVKWGGMRTWWAGPDDSDGKLKFTFKLPRDPWLLSFFETWRDLRLDPETGAAYDKASTIGKISILPVDLNKATARQKYTFTAVAVQGVDAIEFKKDGEAIKEITVNFVYERRLRTVLSPVTTV